MQRAFSDMTDVDLQRIVDDFLAGWPNGIVSNYEAALAEFRRRATNTECVREGTGPLPLSKVLGF